MNLEGTINLDPHQAIMDMKAQLASLYDDVILRGSGRGEFVSVKKGLRAANISLASDNKSWFVELWLVKDVTTGEEENIEDLDIELRQDAIHRISGWLDG